MKCPNCWTENESANKFCIHCGSPLIAPQDVSSPPPEQASPDSTSPQLESLQRELSRQGSIINSLANRLAKIESMLGVAVPSSRPTTIPTSTLRPAALPAREPAPMAVSARREEVSPAKGVTPPPPRETTPRKPIEWEQILGGNWMTRIGVLTLVIGVAFFLKLAFDNQWSVAGVIVGIAAGLALMGGGYYWQKRYPVFAQALSGGGIAFLYLSIYAAFAIFHLVSIYPALIAVLAVSLVSATLAVRQNSMALAILGIIGAFAAPFILGFQAPSGPGAAPGAQGIDIIAYVLLVDVGVLVLSSFRNWRWFTLLSLVGSFASYGIWYSQFGGRAGLLTAEISLTLIFLIFVGVTTLFHIIWRRVSTEADYALMIFNAAYYFGVSYGLMWTPLRAWVGAFALALAAFYGALAYIAAKRNPGGKLNLFATSIALVFFTTAIPVQLGDRAATTIAWTTEAAVLMWLYFRLRLSRFQLYSYIAFALVGVRLLFFDTSLDKFAPVLNSRVLAFLFAIGVMYLTSYLAWRDDKIHPPSAPNDRTAHPIFLMAANFFSLWIIGAEVISYAPPAKATADLMFTFFIFMAGVTTLYHLLWRRSLQIFDMVALAVSAAFYLVMSILLWEHFRSWMGSLYLLLAVFYGALVYVLAKRGKEKDIFINILLGISLAFFTLAVPSQFGDRAWTTIAWAAEMAALMGLSFMLPMAKFRVYSYAVFVILAGRVLLFDTAVDQSIYRSVLNWRFLAFAVTIAATYLTGYQLWRRRQTSPELTIPASTFFIAANIFSLWLLSFEVWDFVGSPLAGLGRGTAPENLRNAQSLSLTTLWAVYAVILLVLGIAKRWRQVRLWGLALLAVPILKLFVYDVWALQLLYRIFAFAALGLLLLIGGYLYQRYGRSIRGIIAKD